jgi:hypothetical protein
MQTDVVFLRHTPLLPPLAHMMPTRLRGAAFMSLAKGVGNAVSSNARKVCTMLLLLLRAHPTCDVPFC